MSFARRDDNGSRTADSRRPANDYDVVIAGAGLAGLTAAYSLIKERADTRILILESADRLGGRTYSADSNGIDLGAAWIWKSSMPLLTKLVDTFGIKLVPQAGGSAGEHRMEHGMSSLIKHLYEAVRGKVDIVRGEKISAVTQLEKDAGLLISSSAPNGHPTSCNNQYSAKHVLLAFPPKKVLQEVDIEFEEKSDDIFAAHENVREIIRRQPVWMSPAGKVALLYKERFWSRASIKGGLPMLGHVSDAFMGGFQAYDAGKTSDGQYNAIVAFVAAGATPHSVTKEQMADKVAAQLAQKMGGMKQQFERYDAVELKLWRTDAHVSSRHEAANFPTHPNPIRGLNDDNSKKTRRIWFANSEGSERYAGMMEGAVHNAMKLARVVVKKLNVESSAK